MVISETNFLTLVSDSCNLTLIYSSFQPYLRRLMSPDTNQADIETTASSEEDISGRNALDALIPFVYEELHRQAHQYLRRERADHTLQTTALINEVYLRLIGQREADWQNRAQFFGIAANMMRRILVDYAKTKHRLKRGGGAEDLPIEDALSLAIDTSGEEKRIDLILLDEALNKLSKLDERQARIVELRYFSGLTVEETAEVLDLSNKTIIREWKVAKAWLRREINSEKL